MKTTEELYNEMMALFTEKTGLDGDRNSDLAVRFYAVAAELHTLFQQAEWTDRQCFPQTASGDYLDLHAELRGIARKQAAKASGTIRFWVDEAPAAPLTIAAGTACLTAGLVRFETTADGTIAAGALYTDVPAEASEAGSGGNAGAETVLTMAVAPVGVSRCTNPAAFTGGRDREDDETLRGRILETYKRLANGANTAYYRQKAMEFDGVAQVTVVPRSRGMGTVDVVVSGAAGLPGDALVAAIQSYFNDAREIAVDVLVKKPTVRAVDVALKLTAESGYSYSAAAEAAESALRGYFTGERLGQGVLRARLGALAFGAEGVANYVLTAPAEDVPADGTVLPVLGTLTIEEGA